MRVFLISLQAGKLFHLLQNMKGLTQGLQLSAAGERGENLQGCFRAVSVRVIFFEGRDRER
jgi:hypothetical protein